MAISAKINQYIENSKIRGQLCRWQKSSVKVFITPITAPIADKNFMYSQVQRAISSWNEVLRVNGINLQFFEVKTPKEADITVRRVKVGRVYEGMCKYVSVIGNAINKISIEVGLENEFSGKVTTDLSIYCAIMHEFGHALGLGHGVEIDDIMYVPHQKNISNPSENDIFILKKIYG